MSLFIQGITNKQPIILLDISNVSDINQLKQLAEKKRDGRIVLNEPQGVIAVRVTFSSNPKKNEDIVIKTHPSLSSETIPSFVQNTGGSVIGLRVVINNHPQGWTWSNSELLSKLKPQTIRAHSCTIGVEIN
jgi:hypothetical protein